IDRKQAAIVHWDGRTWERETLDGAPIIAIAGYGEPVLLGADGRVWRKRGTWTWEDSKVRNASQIVAGAGDDLWVRGWGVARRIRGEWREVVDSVAVSAPSIGVDGSVFLREAPLGELRRWDGATFVKVADSGDRDGELVAGAKDRVDLFVPYKIKSWNGSTWTDIGMNFEASDAVRIGDKIFVATMSKIDDPRYSVVDV